jgi:AraC-like DNA-binding protein
MTMELRAMLARRGDYTLEAVHAPLLQHFAEIVEDCGGGPEPLLERAGLPRSPAALTRATYRQAAELLELAAASLDCPDFGMRLAVRQCQRGVEGPLGHVMRHARCFGDVLELAVQHSYAHSLASRTWLHRAPRGRAILFGHDILLEGLASTAQVMEQILLVGHLRALQLTGGSVGARRILLRHKRLSPARVYRRYFGCEARFDEPINATVYHEADLACPVLSADAPTLQEELAAVERRFPQKQPPLSRIVRGEILHHVGHDDCTCERVAERLGLHTRTLHRRLSREGTSFRHIRDEVRRDAAAYYLQNTDLGIKEISERLGFAEQSALSRRARKWFSGSPSDLRAGRIPQDGEP